MPRCLLRIEFDGKERIKHMARPKKENHPISIRMDKAIYDWLNEFCEVSGQPKTVAIERALLDYMREYYSIVGHNLPDNNLDMNLPNHH